METDLTLSGKHLNEFCNRWRVAELSQDRAPHNRETDGLSVTFEEDAEWSLRDRLRMQREFEALTGQEMRVRRSLSSPRHRKAMRILFNA